MQTFLHRKFKLNFNRLINSNHLLIAISGGQDSICLIKLLNDYLQRKSIKKIEAIYIDHQWKKDSQQHAKHLINIMKNSLIPLTIYQIKDTVFSEAEARQLRYKILVKHARIKKYNTIITGHNQNDCIETLINNLLRGTSLNGITNLTSKKQICNKILLVRPLINFTRPEITWFCRQFCLPIWSDKTNYNHNVTRNKLRNELIPYLENQFNPNLQYNLCKFLELCQDDNEYIKENTIKLYIKSRHRYLISLNLNLLKKQHVILQRRVLQLFFHYNFNQNISNKILKTIIMLENHNNFNKYTIFANNLIIEYTDGWIYTNFSYKYQNNK
uniref:tRNA(Ile)-lysidine synthase, chloroplastic n=1 Tax=Calliarthron tuberculosum TaxID=48942 RepID=M4IV87_CALTB|nr:tRNA(Ile)-lysidine synthase [Calliarthron tuberculosum]AGA63932.1 tRNA(Ile)-lysidine synthase [Calliarthron tuberculosum]